MEKEENKNSVSSVEETSIINNSGRKNQTALIALIILVLVVAIGIRGYYFYKKILVSNPVKITANFIKDLGNSSKEEIKKISDFYGKDKPIAVTINGNVGDIKFNVETESDFKNKVSNIFANVTGLNTDDIYIDGKMNVNDLLIKISKDGNTYKLSEDFKSVFNGLDNYYKNFQADDSQKILGYLAESIEETFTKEDFVKSNKEMSLNNQNIKATVYDTRVNGKQLSKLLGTFIDKITSDDDLISVILDSVKSVDSSVTITKEELVDSLKEAKKEIETDLEGISFDYSIIVYKNNAVGFTISNPEAKFNVEYKDYKNQKSFVAKTEEFAFELFSDKDKLTIKAGVEKNGIELAYDKKEHSYSLTVQNIPILSGTFENIENKNDAETKITFNSLMLGINGSVNFGVKVIDSIKDKKFDNPLDVSEAENLNNFRKEVEENDLLKGLFEIIESYMNETSDWDSLDGFDL